MTRRFQVRIDGTDEPLAVELNGDKVVVDGVPVELSVSPLPGGRMLVRTGERVRVVDCVTEAAPGAVLVHGGDAAIRMTITDERDTWLGVGGSRDGGGTVSVAMPGRVVAVDVSAGDAVTKGQRLLVIEAMKMENDVKSPRDGVVGAIMCVAGDAVEAGEALVELE